MINRREFLKGGLLTGASVFVSGTAFGAGTAGQLLNTAVSESINNIQTEGARNGMMAIRPPKSPVPGGTLDSSSIKKYFNSLVIPPAMPKTANPDLPGIDYYEIAVRQFQQNILGQTKEGAALPDTTVWGYGSINHPGTFNFPSFTIEASYNKPTRVKWINQLVDGSGHYLPHLLPVDPSLHWANPPGPRDSHPTFQNTPGPYTGPVPMVVHVHGAHSSEESDGYAEAWYLPDAVDIPNGYFEAGSKFDEFKAQAEARYGQIWEPGSSVFQYPNDQRAGTIWYHDHSLGMTRLNVYAGPAGFYIIRGGPDDLADGLPGDPYGTKPFEIPIVIQDRSFNADGSLFYPSSRTFFDGATGTTFVGGGGDLPPIWNPEFFGNVMVVNGKAWPKLQVEARRYRFRFLDGCNSRMLILKLVDQDPENSSNVFPLPHALDFHTIGTEGGFLAGNQLLNGTYDQKPVTTDTLLMANAERRDVIIDFTGQAGKSFWLINEGPDSPFGGGVPGVDFSFSDQETTGQIMRFDVVAATGPDTSLPVDQIVLPVLQKLGPPAVTRQVALGENESEFYPGPREAILGLVGKNAHGNPLPLQKAWMDEITETPLEGDTEVWEIYNFTVDGHPIHIHEIFMEVLERENRLTGAIRGPETWESGLKDTVLCYPGEITRIKARFDRAGLFVWHCHIVEHEDNEMMRPYRVLYRTNFPFIGNGG